MRSRRAWAAGCLLLCACVGPGAPWESRATPTAEPEAADALAVYDRVCDLVSEHFHDRAFAGVDWQALVSANRPRARAAGSEDALHQVLDPMLASLHTSHTRFVTASQTAFHDLAGIFGLGDSFPREYADGRVRRDAIGILGRPIADGFLVQGVLHGGPAERAGLLEGDVIMTADGASYQPVESLRGRAGDVVSLALRRRAEDASLLTLEVVPERVSPPAMFLAATRASMRVLQVDGHQLAYVRVWSYADPAVQQALVEALTEGSLSAAGALVLDLRGGWGGANPDDLSLFDAHVPRLELIDRDGGRQVLDTHWRRPVVLLVDRGTRSGKEVLAHAFRRHGLGPVVGERTAGAVTGGRAYPVGPHSLLYLAVRDARVDGQRLEGVGVEPDVVVPFEQAYAAGADPRLERALQLAADLAAEQAAAQEAGQAEGPEGDQQQSG